MIRRIKPENMLYLALWALLFIVPAIMFYVRASANGLPFQWGELLLLWRQFALFLGIFLFHNFVLAPLLLYREKRWIYFGAVTALLAVFVLVQCISRPEEPKVPAHTEMAKGPQPPSGRKAPPKDGRPFDKGRPSFNDGHSEAPPPPPPTDDIEKRQPPRVLTPIVDQHDIAFVTILILMLGMNIGVKLYFRQRDDRQRMADLERQNLEQQLEYLKYQVNPHFLMNTLNNIHALVDIDPEQAKESIVELSKIMRFVLYEGSKSKVPLDRELKFLLNYIMLMRMRISDKVDLQVDMPERIPDAEVPPLLLISFVENAFKHGISYQQPSFIHISITAEEGVLGFDCRNSKIPQAEDRHGGVGLQNVKRRLELIYGSADMLSITETENTYAVSLTLPIKQQNAKET